MEARFGRDFGGVRIHTGTRAASSAQAVGARAYTVGNDIVFGSRAGPDSPDSHGLLMHELAHTLQQPGAGPAASLGEDFAIEPACGALERNADALACDPDSTPALSVPGDRVALQRSPVESAEIEMPAVFVRNPRQRSNALYARQLGREDAARIQLGKTLSTADREDLNAKLAFFEGAAKDAYTREIKPALQQTSTRGDEAATQGPSPDYADAVRVREQNDNYLDNNISKVSYLTAELAIVYYRDGSTLELGLAPKWMKPPYVEVDYRTPRGEIRPFVNSATKETGFFLERELGTPWTTGGAAPAIAGNLPYAEVIRRYLHRVDYYLDHKSLRIVPSRVNMLTAPNLCRVLLDSEAQFLTQSRELIWVARNLAIIAGLTPTGGIANAERMANAGGNLIRQTTPKAVMSAAGNAAEQQLFSQFDDLIRTGGQRNIVLEGATFAGVKATRQGETLAVSRFMTEVPERLRGQGVGAAANAAFEQSAAAVARMSGFKTVTIDVGFVINHRWRMFLERSGYVKTEMSNAFGGSTFVWVKTIKL